MKDKCMCAGARTSRDCHGSIHRDFHICLRKQSPPPFIWYYDFLGVLTLPNDNHNKEIVKNSINFNTLFSINPYSPGVSQLKDKINSMTKLII